jgi:signal transduction histidine kinase
MHFETKDTRSELSARYTAMLRSHVRAIGPNGSHPARIIGQDAVDAGLTLWELKQIHERAWHTLAKAPDSNRRKNASKMRAKAFLVQALIPIAASQRGAAKAYQHLVQRKATLKQHNAALAHGTRRLEREVTRRKAGQVRIDEAKDLYRTLFLESQLMQDKLRQLTRQIISAQEEERKRISRELHDEVVQLLVGINVELSALGHQATLTPASLRRKISQTQRLVQSSVQAVHRFARELRPAVLDDLGLIPALHAYTKSLADRKGIRVKMTAYSGVETLPIAARTVLFRVAQEALNNVARHAGATDVKIAIMPIAGVVRLEIVDNGKSFQLSKTLRAKTNKRLGLVGMRERIEMIGGTLEIESAPGAGTAVRAEIPFKPEKKHK